MTKTLLYNKAIDNIDIEENWEYLIDEFSAEICTFDSLKISAPQDVIDFAIKRMGDIDLDIEKETSLIDHI